MTTASQFAADTPAYVRDYWERGYAIVRGVIAPDEIAELREAFDRTYAEGLRLGRTWRHQNRLFWVNQHPTVGRFVSGCQWQAWADPVLDRFRTHPKLMALLQPLIGVHLKQIINQMHWKVPGTGYTWGLHQDVRSRKPEHCFRELATSYVQTGLAIDRHWAGNGAMQVIPFSHRRGDLRIDGGAAHHDDTRESAVAQVGIDPREAVSVEMEPGDIALWGPYLIHGGGINSTPDNFRRLYINGYVKADNCDRGQPVLDHGRPVPLTLPALIQYDGLYTNPHPHHPEDRASQQQRD
jgi:ectoine hydroxylase-related dioxygenase (phytanoyl-CoA dioxygenase family)